jgi:hypothetical protein
VELLILIFIVGLILGYCILHPLRSIKYCILLVCVMVLGLVGVALLFSIPWIIVQFAH